MYSLKLLTEQYEFFRKFNATLIKKPERNILAAGFLGLYVKIAVERQIILDIEAAIVKYYLMLLLLILYNNKNFDHTT